MLLSVLALLMVKWLVRMPSLGVSPTSPVCMPCLTALAMREASCAKILCHLTDQSGNANWALHDVQKAPVVDLRTDVVCECCPGFVGCRANELLMSFCAYIRNGLPTFQAL